jgi:nicotinate phosphoribosyltransferase
VQATFSLINRTKRVRVADDDCCAATPNGGLDPISLVCKVTSADGRPAVKFSDKPRKASGARARSALPAVFGIEDRVERLFAV